MATSGITIYQLTRDQIIEASLGVLAVLAQGQTPSAEDYTVASKYLNTTVARLRAEVGLPLWARKQYSWVPTTSTYLIGEGQTLNTSYPLHILQAYRTTSGGAHVPIDIEADYDFNLYPAATSSSVVLKLTYTPANNFGTIKLWPTGLSTNTDTITIVYTRPIEYFNNSTDTMDLPEEWYDALIWDLAVKLAPRWGIPVPERNELKEEAKVFWEQARQTGFEDASFFVAPYRRP